MWVLNGVGTHAPPSSSSDVQGWMRAMQGGGVEGGRSLQALGVRAGARAALDSGRALTSHGNLGSIAGILWGPRPCLCCSLCRAGLTLPRTRVLQSQQPLTAPGRGCCCGYLGPVGQPRCCVGDPGSVAAVGSQAGAQGAGQAKLLGAWTPVPDGSCWPSSELDTLPGVHSSPSPAVRPRSAVRNVCVPKPLDCPGVPASASCFVQGQQGVRHGPSPPPPLELSCARTVSTAACGGWGPGGHSAAPRPSAVPAACCPSPHPGRRQGLREPPGKPGLSL